MVKYTRIFILLLAISCTDNNPTPKGVIDPQFTVYVDRFVQEAGNRNVKLDVKDLSVISSPTLITGDDHVPACGLTSSPHGTPLIQIAETNGCWTALPATSNEELIFHELGHALLKRQHDISILPNSEGYKSIMNGLGILDLYTKYTPDKRKYYLDELFNPNTPIPDWAKEKLNSTEILNNANVPIESWEFKKVSDLDQVGTIINENNSPALVIEAPTQHLTNQSSYWKYSFTPSNIAVGSELVLRAKVKVFNVTSNGGVYLTFRGDAIDDTVFTVTSSIISGTQDFIEYSATLAYFPEQIKTISIFLTIDATSSGTVYFEDVRLINNY